MCGRIPDAKTIWFFRDLLVRAQATIDALFATFDAHLHSTGYLAMSGQIVDASIILSPKRRDTDEEKQALKEGRVPETWTDSGRGVLSNRAAISP